MGLRIDDELYTLSTALENAGVDYALAGGLALAIWGAPRATQDIDLLVQPAQLAAALECALVCGFDTPALPMRFAHGLEIQRVSKLSASDVLSVDFLSVHSQLAEVWHLRQECVTLRGRLWVVSRDGLIRMKASSGRTQDLADIERLRELER